MIYEHSARTSVTGGQHSSTKYSQIQNTRAESWPCLILTSPSPSDPAAAAPPPVVCAKILFTIMTAAFKCRNLFFCCAHKLCCARVSASPPRPRTGEMDKENNFR